MQRTQEQILKAYEEKSEAILQKMAQVFLRAQRKVDDNAYREALEKIEKETLKGGK
ncbi:MAG TPA: hypothetical protein VNW29_02835 [Candidatus Sulfotelmatobacter sp.]|nr:hypothetical protein [Candidatus Sulfotelmatobacter sp.]